MSDTNLSLVSALVKSREMSRVVHNTLVVMRSPEEVARLGGRILLLKKVEYAAQKVSSVLRTAGAQLALANDGGELWYIKWLRNQISDTLERSLVLASEFDADHNTGPEAA